MPFIHAVIWMDHHTAHVIEFDREHMQERHIRAHVHPTRQHQSNVRSEHEFFAEVCDAVGSMESVLLTGARRVQADLRHFVEKHRPGLAQRITGWEIVDHPTSAQLVALARHRQQQAASGLATGN
jgi:stalled ribosome rescue protein Dom34